MKHLTIEEYHQACMNINGLGFIHFMGGQSPKEGCPTIVIMMDERRILFESYEIQNDEYKQLMKEQELEAKAYVDFVTH